MHHCFGGVKFGGEDLCIIFASVLGLVNHRVIFFLLLSARDLGARCGVRSSLFRRSHCNAASGLTQMALKRNEQGNRSPHECSGRLNDAAGTKSCPFLRRSRKQK